MSKFSSPCTVSICHVRDIIVLLYLKQKVKHIIQKQVIIFSFLATLPFLQLIKGSNKFSHKIDQLLHRWLPFVDYHSILKEVNEFFMEVCLIFQLKKKTKKKQTSVSGNYQAHPSKAAFKIRFYNRRRSFKCLKR